MGQLVDLFDGPAALQRAEHGPHPPVVGNREFVLERSGVFFGVLGILATPAIGQRSE